MWPHHWLPQTAAARNAPGEMSDKNRQSKIARVTVKMVGAQQQLVCHGLNC